MALLLEAQLRRYSLRRCINSWASARLQCEAFRNKSSQAKSKAKDAADKERQSKESSIVTEDNVIEESVIEEPVIEDTSNEDAASVGLCDNCEDGFENKRYEDEQNYLLYSQDEDDYLSYHEDYEEGDHVYGNSDIETVEDASPSIE